ncbi:MAG TPA: hypothetical protein VK633_00330 [Verrucomicrobiae bacterium]|nr:hypothetical protein [Verrucomicrobiae bacterium]
MDERIAQRVRRYAQRFNARVGSALGSGHHGNVVVAERNAIAGRYAVKFCKENVPFDREVHAYKTLAERKVIEIAGFFVPQLLGYDDELLVIEMTIVEPPFILDFGGAYDELSLPDFTENIWSEWREQKQEEFGGNWPRVEEVLSILISYGIHMIDIHPRNIVFRESIT